MPVRVAVVVESVQTKYETTTRWQKAEQVGEEEELGV